MSHFQRLVALARRQCLPEEMHPACLHRPHVHKVSLLAKGDVAERWIVIDAFDEAATTEDRVLPIVRANFSFADYHTSV
jgi:hypothetical protein